MGEQKIDTETRNPDGNSQVGVTADRVPMVRGTVPSPKGSGNKSPQNLTAIDTSRNWQGEFEERSETFHNRRKSGHGRTDE